MPISDRIAPLLSQVKSPAWYIGGEVNSIRKDKDKLRGRIALVYPDCYDVGMSHYGLKILYHVVNGEPDLCAERAYAPWPDFGELLRANGIPLYSLESHSPLHEFDVLGFTIQSELTLTNVLYVLDLAQIPLLSVERDTRHPLVVAGGAGAYGPEVLADVVDLFALGDGEEMVVPLLRDIAERRRRGQDRRSILIDLVRRYPFLYAPSLYGEVRGADGTYQGLKPSVDGLPTRIRSAYVYDLENAPFPTAPVVPHTQIVHDRIALEVMRGCVHGCRFCQAGMLTRPWRVRSPRKLEELAAESYRNTGIEEISLLSLSTSDYPYLKQAVDGISERFKGCNVGISLPSLRVNQQLRLLPSLQKEGRRAGLTLAPEVATDRLRRKVNKPIHNEDLYAGVREAFKNGWRSCKLYFMLGIPDEIETDLDGIVEMGETVSRIGKEVTGHPAAVTVSVSTFVPKPFTPYQWDGMIPLAEIRARQDRLRARRRMKSVTIKCHDARESLVEGVLARGDRRVGRVLLDAYRLGAIYDGWRERFRFDLWQRAFTGHGLDLEALATRTIPYEEALPWDHLDAGPSREFLLEDSKKARAERTTENCFGERCNRCGVDARDCFDLKHAMPKVALAPAPAPAP